MKRFFICVVFLCSGFLIFSQTTASTVAATSRIIITAPEKPSMLVQDLYAVVIEGEIVAELAAGERFEFELPAEQTVFYFFPVMTTDGKWEHNLEITSYLQELSAGKTYHFQINAEFSPGSIKLKVTEE